MPIYEFSCSACGHKFDRLQKLADPDPTDCPACSAVGSISRLISAPQFRLAGGGWYETDFKSDQDKKRNLAGDSGDKSADSKTEAKPETKTEAKPDSKPDAAKAEPVKAAAPASSSSSTTSSSS
jgi:putative FmdB family regulatory protein